MNLIVQPSGVFSIGDFLVSHLEDSRWTEFRAAIAFAKYSGVRHILSPLKEFAERGRFQLSVGVDFAGTTTEGLQALYSCIGPKDELWVYHNELGATFHPKFFYFGSDNGTVDIAIGSGNLTEGGLYTNYEAFLAVSLNEEADADAAVISQAKQTLDLWCDKDSGLALPVDEPLIEALQEGGYIISEMQSARAMRSKARGGMTTGARKALFATAPIAKPAPPANSSTALATTAVDGESETAIDLSADMAISGFAMTLQRTDVGVGQLSAGAARRSPEIFIPLKARNHAPEFWGWPDSFSADEDKPGKMDRRGVRMWLGTTTIDVNMMTWPDKHDFRLRSEALRSAGSIGDILRIEKTDGTVGFDYMAYIIPQGTMEHKHYLGFCINKAAGKSKKLWGYY